MNSFDGTWFSNCPMNEKKTMTARLKEMMWKKKNKKKMIEKISLLNFF